MSIRRALFVSFAALAVACKSASGADDVAVGGATSSSAPTGATTSGSAALPSSSSSGSASSSSTGQGGASNPPTAAQLLAVTQTCNQASNGLYKFNSDPATPANVPICSLTGAYFWTADMDVDCDGQTTPECNINTDPAYQNQTSATD